MTSERPRFPLGLTLCAAIAFVILIGLGGWQVQRAHWKARQLVKIAALRDAPPQPINLVLQRAARGEDVTNTRVAADCLPAPPELATDRITTDGQTWVTQVLSVCRLASPDYGGVWVDRGVLSSSRGSTTPANVIVAAPAHVVGILYYTRSDCPPPPSPCRWRDKLHDAAPYTLVVEHETPPPPGVEPSPYRNAADNLQYVGAYAPTWFGLAGVLVCIYAAMLWRRYHPKA
jgi:surfeit locus 1 family protein